MGDNVNPYISGLRAKPNAVADVSSLAQRGSLYGDAMMQPVGSARDSLCSEGSYFISTNPTIGTAVLGIAAADGYDATEALALIRNAATSAKQVHLDYIKLVVGAAGTGGTTFGYALTLDTGGTRYTSGGAAITAINPNMDSVSAAEATGYFGALVTGAASASARIISHAPLRPVIKVIGDSYTFVFGRGAGGQKSALAVAGTAITDIVVHCPPVVLGASDELLLHEYAASQTVAASYHFEIGWWER